MKWDQVLFAVFLALGLLVAGLVFVVPEADGEGGTTHPRFPSMSHGGTPERHAALGGWAYAFGLLCLTSFGAMIAFCVRREGRLRGLGPHLTWVTLVFVVLWTALMAAYCGTFGDRQIGLFPIASSIMIWLLYPATVLYNLLFVFGFERWVLSDQDHAAYRRLIDDSGDGS